MNLIYLSLLLRKSLSGKYKRTSLKFFHDKDPEELTKHYIGLCTVFFFFIGLTYEAICYAFSDAYLLVGINLISLFIHIAVSLFYFCGKLGSSTALAVLFYTIQLNITVSMYYSYILNKGNGYMLICHELLIGFLICTLASLTLGKRHIYILCAMPLTVFVGTLYIRSSALLAEHLPSLCFAYFSTPMVLSYIRSFIWNAVRQKEQLVKEKQSLCRLVGMNEQQWDLLLEVIMQPYAPREQTEKLFKQLQEGIGNQLTIRAKRLLTNEKMMGEINKKKNLALTAKEVHLCCLILEDKTISEISKILYINESSVRGNRSRIRKKMGLDKDVNLKEYLLTLFREENENFIFFL